MDGTDLETVSSERTASATDDLRSSLRFDLVAGLVGASVVLPKAMAYATVAGLPVEVGLYTALIPMAVYGLLGSSAVLSVSSTTTLAILTGAELAAVVPGAEPARQIAAVATLTALVGVLLILAKVMRLGFVANFISTPVLTGFKAGIGLVILLDQLPKLFGLHIAKSSFLMDIGALLKALPETSIPTFVIALASCIFLVAMEKFRPHSPAPLVAVALAIAVSAYFHMGDYGVATVGHIPRGLPSVTLPDVGLVEQLLPGALGIALMSFTETIAAGRAFAGRDDPPVKPDRELVATGLANLAGAFLGAMPAGGGTSQTSVVRSVGGRSQKASLVTALAALATMLFLAPLLGLLPSATLAAVVIVYSAPLIRIGDFATIRRVRHMEFRWALFAAVGVLLFGTLQGIVVAIVLSLVGLSAQTANPRVSVIGRKRGADVLRPFTPETADDETFDGLLIVRPEGRLFFVNAQNVAEQITQLIGQHRPRVVALDLSRVPDVEYSALEMIEEGDRRMAEQGITLWLVGLNPGVLEVIRHAGLDTRFGRDRLLFNARIAIERFTATRADKAAHVRSAGEKPPAAIT